SNANHSLERRYDDLPVADLASSRRLADGFDHLSEQIVGDRRVNLDPGSECHFVIRATVDLSAAPLSTKTSYLGRGEARYSDGGQRLEYRVELGRADGRADHFQGSTFRAAAARAYLRQGGAHPPSRPSRGISRSNVEVQIELPGMWTQSHRIDLFLALVLQPGIDHVLGEHVAP